MGGWAIRLIISLVITWVGANSYAQGDSMSIVAQLHEQVTIQDFTHQDTFISSIRIYNHAHQDSLYQVQISNAQINRSIINSTDTMYAGRFVGDNVLQSGQLDYYWPITFKANAWTQIDVTSYNLSDHNFRVKVKLVLPDQLSPFLDRWMVRNSRGAFLNIFFLGAVLALLLYFGMLSFLSPRKDFVIYAIYLAFVFLHYMLSTDTSMRLGIFFPDDPINNILINEFTLNMMYAVYIYFAYSFLEVKRLCQWVKWFLFFQLAFHVFLAVLFTSVLVHTKAILYVKSHLYDLYFIAFALSIVSLILIYIRIPGRIKYFVIVGSLILSIASLLEVLNDTHIYRWFEYSQGEHRYLSLNVTQVGIFLELICFSLGIGYKHNSAFKEKESAQLNYIAQLKKNKELQDQYTDQLQKEVEIQAKELTAEKEISLRSQYENRIMQLESDMLLSQMNPHFIFNSLNSIKYFALTKSLEETADYITDFSKLMRMILENSREKSISLNDEVNFLKLYLSIEARRYENAFSYDVSVEESVDLHNNLIPVMIVQPIVENSLVHGLVHKQHSGKINVEFKKQNEAIVIRVRDNGIGRVAAAKNNMRKTQSQKSSLATAIMKERIDLYNNLNNFNASLKILDLYDEKGIASGTHVEIYIPQRKH